MAPMNDQEKLRVLLTYWMEHNLEHAQEFRQWAERAETFGSKEAASKLRTAAQDVITLNDSLRAVQNLLAGPMGPER